MTTATATIKIEAKETSKYILKKICEIDFCFTSVKLSNKIDFSIVVGICTHIKNNDRNVLHRSLGQCFRIVFFQNNYR